MFLLLQASVSPIERLSRVGLSGGGGEAGGITSSSVSLAAVPLPLSLPPRSPRPASSSLQLSDGVSSPTFSPWINVSSCNPIKGPVFLAGAHHSYTASRCLEPSQTRHPAPSEMVFGPLWPILQPQHSLRRSTLFFSRSTKLS